MFGVWVEKSMYGKKYIGSKGPLFYLMKNFLGSCLGKVKVKNHVEEVLNHISKIS